MSSTEEAWGEVAEHLRTLGTMLVERTAEGVDVSEPSDAVPSNDEVREAVRVISDRASATLAALTEGIRDPEVRTEAELTTSAFLTAVGVSFSELGAQLTDLATRSGSDRDVASQGTWEPADRDLED